MTPQEILEKGAAELAAVLASAGFAFVLTGGGESSGGTFASGEYRRDERRLELHVRESLGLVKYHVGVASLSHKDLVRAVGAIVGITEEPMYPGFSQDPTAGFRHLRADLARFGTTFLAGSVEDFRALRRWVDEHPKKVGLAALS